MEGLIAEAVGDPARAGAVAEAAAILRDHHRLVARARAVLGEDDAPERAGAGVLARVGEHAPAYDAGQPYRYDPALITHQRSLHEMVRVLLEAMERPMHVRAIAAHIRGSGWRSPRGGADTPGKLEAQIASRLVKHPDLFERVAPNTFGLAGWPRYEPRAKALFPVFDGLGQREGISYAEWIGDHPEAPFIDPDNSPWS